MDPTVGQIIFFVTPKVSNMERISKIIHYNQKNKIDKTYYLFFWPRRTILCKEALKTLGVIKILKIIYNYAN